MNKIINTLTTIGWDVETTTNNEGVELIKGSLNKTKISITMIKKFNFRSMYSVKLGHFKSDVEFATDSEVSAFIWGLYLAKSN